jgi:putative two-component system response regulator
LGWSSSSEQGDRSLGPLLPVLARLIEARDPHTQGHCERLADYSVALGDALGLGREDLTALRQGGVVHDIGKIGIPDSVLLKPGRLTDDEYEMMKQHPVIGDALFAHLPAFAAVRPIVRHHHERLDGSGYPDALRGDEIPLLAQIISIVDCFDAMTSTRPYRQALSIDAACEELRRDVQRGALHPDLVGTFISLVQGSPRQVHRAISSEHALRARLLFLGAA